MSDAAGSSDATAGVSDVAGSRDDATDLFLVTRTPSAWPPVGIAHYHGIGRRAAAARAGAACAQVELEM